jgi:hypothetical protein
MPRFVDDDEGYLDWSDANPDGFTLNIERSLNPRDAYLHKASCRSLIDDRKTPADRTSSWIKVSAVDREDLIGWMRAETGSTPNICSKCL